MKYLRNGLYIAILLLMFLSACGGATPTPTGLVNQKTIPLPNVIVTVVPPALGCIPPAPAVGDVSSSCANPIKGVGGVTFSDVTNLQADGTNSWLVGDNLAGNVSCKLDNTTSIGICSGAPNGSIQVEVCSSCTVPNAPASNNWVCSPGHGLGADQQYCGNDPTKAYDFCPPGSYYDNALQNCADNVTHKLASPCPPGYPSYSPGEHKCFAKVQEMYKCQTFTLKLGACLALNQVPKVVPFCQNNAANIGGANITYPAGSSLSVDVKASHLASCTPGGTKADGTQLITCLGTGGTTFEARLCTDAADPASCTSYKEALGDCAGKSGGSGGAPCVPDPRTGTCP